MTACGGRSALVAALMSACAADTSSVEQTSSALEVVTRIEAEDYVLHREWVPWHNAGRACERGDGVDMERTSDSNGGGCNVGWTLPGESLGYRISVASAQTIDLTLRVASPFKWARLHVLLNGERVRTLHAMTGGFQRWEDRTLSDLALAPGENTLTVEFATGGVNLNYLTWSASGGGSPGGRAPLPWWISYCDEASCSGARLVLDVCPDDDPECTPSRETTVVPSVDGAPITQLFLPLHLPEGYGATYEAGNGVVQSPFMVVSFGGPVVIRSDVDLRVSYYEIPAVWGGITEFNLISESFDSPELHSTVYRHPSILTQGEGAELHERGRVMVARQSQLADIHPGKMNAFFLPAELATVGEGNFADGFNKISMNYGHPAYIEWKGDVYNAALPRFAHEYAHELFSEVIAFYPGIRGCFDEGVADAFAYTSGYLPLEDFGPIGSRGNNYDLGCAATAANGSMHELGECPLWQALRVGELTPEFTRALFHPRHVIDFDSCNLNEERTGNALLVLFSEAAERDMTDALTLAGIPHAGSYAAALAALGL